MKKSIITACLIAAWAFAPTSFAGVDEMAKECDNCHGKDGVSEHGEVPVIAGMSGPYLKDMMVAYQSGDRPGIKYKPKDGDETDMNALAKKLSEAEIGEISAYYAGKKFQAQKQAVDADLAKKGAKIFDKACEKCHSEGGTLADDDAGILAGQWKPYMEEQFKLFDEKKRTMTKKMAKKYEELSADDKKAVIEFLAGAGG